MKKTIDDLAGLCPYCEHRFRRVFKPDSFENFIDEEGTPLTDYMEDGDVMIFDICLLTDIPMGKDITYECSHYSPKEDDDKEDDYKPTLFKYLK